jgi:hypothetical protein
MVRPRLAQETQPLGNAAVEIYEFIFGKLSDIDLHGRPPDKILIDYSIRSFFVKEFG